MPDRPIVPSRIIPASEPLPDLPGRTPGPEDLPPWRTTAPPKPPPPPPPAPPPTDDAVEPEPQPMHVTVVVVPEPEPEPERHSWDFGWLWRWMRPWQSLIAVALAVIPIPPYGHSLGTGWAATLTQCRDEAGLMAAYTLAIGALLLTAFADARSGRWYWRTLLAAAFIGVIGMVHLYDIVTAVTGVKP